MRYTLLIFSLLCFCACNNRKVMNAVIDRADAVVNMNPDSALAVLQQISRPELLEDSLLAKYWLVKGQIHYNLSEPMLEDSLLSFSLDYYKGVTPKNSRRLVQAYKLWGQYLWWADRKDESAKILEEGLRAAEADKDTIGCIHLLKSMMNMEMGDNRFEDALHSVKKLIALDGNNIGMSRSNNECLAIAYYYLHRKDSALLAYERIMEQGTTPADSVFLWAYSIRNYADLLSDFGEHRKAIEVQRKVLEHYRPVNHPFMSLSYMALARYHLNLHETDSARHYMQLAEEAKQPNVDEDLSLSNYYTVQKTLMNYVDTKEFIIRDLVLFSNNMYDRFVDNQKIIAGKNRMQLLLEQKNLNLTIEKQREQMIFLAVFFVFVLLLIIVLLYVRRRKRLLEEKEEELEALKRLLTDAGSTNNKDDKFFKKILLQQLGVIRMVATRPTADNQDLLQRMVGIANKDIPVDELLVWEDLYKTIDYIYDNFYSNAKNKFGSVLNERELQLCCLLKANFSTKEISVVIQQSVRTIYQRKTVIRQKLNMEEKEDIAEFLS